MWETPLMETGPGMESKVIGKVMAKS